MSRIDDFSFNIQQLCSFCYSEKKYCVFKYDKCVFCNNRNINPVYVNAKNHSEFVRDFRFSGNADRGLSIEICKHEEIYDKYKHATIRKGCSYATSDYEYFVWNWMKTHRKYKISDIFNEFIAPYIFTLKASSHIYNVPVVTALREQQNSINPVPQSSEENKRIHEDEKKKLYFCWFCFKNVTSEHDIIVHLKGTDHKSYYEADKKRRWYFKMPRTKPVTLCTKSDCDCFDPHTEDELREMNARIKFRNFNFKSFDLEKKEIRPWPKNIEFTMPMFPNNLKSYQKSIRNTATVILKGWTVTYICLRDDESRPFFTLYSNDNKQKGQILNSELFTKDKLIFDIEFFPLCSGTYIQRIEFGFEFQNKEYCCQKYIRVDVGTPKHLEQFRNIWTKFCPILKRDLKFDTITPFSISNVTNNSIMTEELLQRVFQIVPNLQWIDTRVEPWNYCDWMRDMLVHEELEQQLLLSQLLYIGNMEVTSSFTKDTFIPPKPGRLFGTIKFKNECHDSFAREFLVQNINKVFLLYHGPSNTCSLYECDLVDKYYYDVESRSLNEATLCIPESAVKSLQLKHGMKVQSVTIIFRFNRLVFERRHASLDKIPHYDGLTYTPLCCPSFTRLPYGEEQSKVYFNPKLTLNTEQKRLPRLVLRNLENDEIVLPFILNGAFGTGKSSVIAETINTILTSGISRSCRVLICTRSYSAGKVYLNMFKGCLASNFLNMVKLIVSVKKVMDYEFKQFWIYNDALSLDVFMANRVFITTLDNVTYAMSHLLSHFMEDNAMFDFLFVDEAAQVLEIDAISVYQFGNKKSKFIFAGDVFQVRPDYYNMSLKKFSVPIVCRLHISYKRCPDYEICLKQVYRTHPKLVEYLSEAIYFGCGLISKMIPKYELFPMKFIDSSNNGTNREEYDDLFCSYKNDLEAEMIILAVQTLLGKVGDKGLTPDKILICTPFFSQVKSIRDKMKKKRISVLVELPSNIQGKEFDAVFISTVLTVNNELIHPILHPTFHSNKNLINLAISRAKHYVEVIGDKQCLLQQQCHVQWKKFLELSLH